MRFIVTLLFVLMLLITGSLKTQNITLNVESMDVISIVHLVEPQTGFLFKFGPHVSDGAKKLSIHVKNKPLIQFLIEDLCKGQPFTFDIRGEQFIVLYKREPPETINANNKPSSGGEPPANDSIERRTQNLPEVIHTGVQQIDIRLHVGSRIELSKADLQQRTTPDIYKRLEGYAPGLLLTVNSYPGTYQPKHVAIGGRSTIYSGPDPLIILNGFRFIGRLEDINPDDIETITFLRDASATTLWGALSGNCVIVVTTRPLHFNQPIRISFNGYVRSGSAPDAFAKDMLPPSDRMYVDSLLARNGFYNFLIRNPAHPNVPELALRLLNNMITDDELNRLRHSDIRNDLNKYIYRRTLEKHLSLEVAGGKKENACLFSLGLDHTLPELVLSKTQRLNASFNFLNHAVDGLELSATIATTYYKQLNIDGEPNTLVTYANLMNDSDEPAVQSYKRNKFFIDTAGVDANGRKKLRDWGYRPLKEFRLRDHDILYTDHRLQLSLKFAFLKRLEASVNTQYELSGAKENELKSRDGFYVNDLVNSYTQVNGSSVERPVPVGDILDYSQTNVRTANIRAQLKYTKSLGDSTIISILVGSDRTITKGKYSARRIYDYTPEKPEGQSNLNYQLLYPQYYFPASALYIPYLNDAKRTAGNDVSWYANASLQLNRKYHAFIAARTDRSNIYGSTTNRRFKPFGSVGFAWDTNEEDFFHTKIVQRLKLRTSIGLCGNPPLGASAIQTISKAGKNENGDVFADINNPALPNLKWETVMTYNFGVSLTVLKQKIDGTVDYYYKKSTDVVGYKTTDPTVGTPGFWGNVASMASHNVDVVINTKNINGQFRWGTKFIFTYLKEFVTRIDPTLQQAWIYCDPSRFSVVLNRPVNGNYSFYAAARRLDETGDPVGPGGNKDYQAITLQPGPGSLHYNGRRTPPVFGSITNLFNWKQWSLSVTLLYKLGYYYRKPSVNYSGIFDGSDAGTDDFSKRWQKPGDEAHTSVPRLVYPANSFRDYFYLFSDALVKRADFIRLHNVNLSYDLKDKALRKRSLCHASFYVNCDNAGIIWRATKSKIDPDNLLGFPTPTILTVGFRATLR